MGTLVSFVLYTNLWLSRATEVKAGWSLLSSLTVCGAAQGLMFVSLQTLVLLSIKSEVSHKVVQWIGSTIGCMMVGMTLPLGCALLSPEPLTVDAIANYVVAGWGLSWALAGLVWGAIAGRNKRQKFRWGLINAGAYFSWGIAATFGWRLLVALLENGPAADFASVSGGIGVLIVVMLSLGIGLNNFIFKGLMR